MGLVFVVDFVYGLLDIKTLVNNGKYLGKVERMNKKLSLGFFDGIVFRLEPLIDFSLFLDIEKVCGHQLSQRVDWLNTFLHSILEPCLKMKNSLE